MIKNISVGGVDGDSDANLDVDGKESGVVFDGEKLTSIDRSFFDDPVSVYKQIQEEHSCTGPTQVPINLFQLSFENLFLGGNRASM